MIRAGVFLFLAAVKASDVTFYLFTQKNPNDYVQIDASQYVKNDNKIEFLIHGWSENRTTQWYEPLKNALLSRSDVIEVDYREVAAQPYPVAVKDSVQVGEQVGDFIIALTKQGVFLENIQITGHSLGGQVAGYASGYVFQKTSKKVPRITALDPAGPFFQGFFNINGRSLSPDDAEIVFVIHTDRNLFGQHSACGTIDVFPNGGSGVQPGCPDGDDRLFCSHHRSYWYYISAVQNPGSLFAVKCDGYRDFLTGRCDDSRLIDLGGELTVEDRGLYFLETSARKPYRVLP